MLFSLDLPLFLMYTISSVTPFTFFLKHSHNMIFLKNLLAHYSNFHIIFHIESDSERESLEFFKTFCVDNPTPITIYKHNSQNLTRPFGLKCVNIVAFSNPLDFTSYLKYKNNILAQDVVVFITRPSSFQIFSKDLCFLPRLERAGSTIVIEIRKQILKIYKICFYCGIESGKLRLEQEVDDKNYKVSQSLVEFREFTNFNKHLMKVAYINYYPYAYCLKGYCKKEDIHGQEIDLLKILSLQLNFSYSMIRLFGNYDKIFEGLSAEHFDFAIGGIGLTPERTKLVQFSNVFNFENIVAAFVMHPPFKMRFFALFRVFPLLMWLGIVLSSISVILFIHCFLVLETKARLRNISQLIFGSFFEQSINLNFKYYQKKLAIMLLFYTWFIFVFFIDAMYRTKSSSSRIPPNKKRIVSLDQLLVDGYNLVLENSVSQSFSETVTDLQIDKYRSLGLVVVQPSFCSSLTYIKKHQTILIGELSHLFLHGPLFCLPKKLRTTSFLRTFRMAFTPLSTTLSGWPFKFGTPFVYTISKCINRILSVGLLSKVENTLNSGIFKDKPPMRGNVRLMDLMTPLILFGCGMAIAGIVFALEILWKKKTVLKIDHKCFFKCKKIKCKK